MSFWVSPVDDFIGFAANDKNAHLAMGAGNGTLRKGKVKTGYLVLRFLLRFVCFG